VTDIRQMAPRSTTRCTKHYIDGPLATQSSHSFPLGYPWGGEGQGGVHLPITQKLKSRGRSSRPCNTDGARGVPQTNRQTNFPSLIVDINNSW